MNLLCVYYSCYFEIRNNTIFTMPAYDINYWQKYLEVFDTITIVPLYRAAVRNYAVAEDPRPDGRGPFRDREVL